MPRNSLELEDEQGGEDDVAHYGGERRQHGFLGMARGTHHVVHAYHDVGEGRARQDYLHEVAGVGQGLAAGAEEAQDGVEEEEGQPTEYHGIDEAERQRVAQHPVHAFHIFLPQADGRDGGAARRHQVAEGRREIHQREGDGQTRDGHGAHTMTYENAVYDVVERNDGHPDDGRDGVLHQQLPDAFRAEYVRIVHKQVVRGLSSAKVRKNLQGTDTFQTFAPDF